MSQTPVHIKTKTPAICASANIAREVDDGSSVIKLFSCAAWYDLDAVNLQILGIQRRDTWVRPEVGENFESCVNRIGEQAAKLCESCGRFKPKDSLAIGWSGPTDGEFTPSPASEALEKGLVAIAPEGSVAPMQF